MSKPQDRDETCPNCNGSGQESFLVPGPSAQNDLRRCPLCRGTGRVDMSNAAVRRRVRQYILED